MVADMATSVDNVRVGLTGGVRVAPTGTTAPTTAVATYAAGWSELGLLNEDGIVESANQDVTEIKSWQDGATARKITSAYDVTFKFTVIETNNAVWTLYYPGSTLSGTSGASVLTVKVPASDPRAFGFDVTDGSKHLRIIVPKGEISERGDIVYKNDEAIGYEFTMTCYRASDGTVMIKYTDDVAVFA